MPKVTTFEIIHERRVETDVIVSTSNCLKIQVYTESAPTAGCGNTAGCAYQYNVIRSTCRINNCSSVKFTGLSNVGNVTAISHSQLAYVHNSF